MEMRGVTPPKKLLTTGQVMLARRDDLQVEDSSYSEPPDVQQQLNHYQSAALARNNSRVSPVPSSGTAAGSEQKAEAVLHCEFCEFSSGYIQSIRRHYRDKHGGKKLFKCKDCSFYTGFKSAFTMHVEAGHSAVPEEGPKDLRCPLCLYHTKYKRNMIDHIVLHRGNLQTGSGVLGPAGRWRCSILRMLPVDRSSIDLFPGLCSSRLESQ
ncbi:hypothetical protein U0070_020691 [Myodes glareolus]|uniref:C2H2-type domain-containing protein n=1 Tax=Myodes glareolus TaxID=447135 RepID=A0AAW0K452_MYOGA